MFVTPLEMLGLLVLGFGLALLVPDRFWGNL